jgi:hypothetical protein
MLTQADWPTFVALALRRAIPFCKGDAGYLVLAIGEVEVSRILVHAREGLVIENEEKVAIKALTDSELVLVVTAK